MSKMWLLVLMTETETDVMNKPPYTIPTMAEIDQMPHNGYEVVSTFSGGGGSCLGYRMAGFKVIWANEFIEAAQQTYKANFPDTFLDHRDIREIATQDILETIGRQVGEIDLLDGSPPCNPFSTAGKRHKGWGKVGEYSGKKQRTDNLFFEYARILEGIKPRVFVAENVKGLVTGKAKGYFKEILQALKNAGYRVKAKVLYASWMGVPTTRPRLFFVGVRNNLELDPVFPKPLPYQYTLRDALPWIDLPDDHADVPPVEIAASMEGYAIAKFWETTEIGKCNKKRFNLVRCSPDKPAGTVTASGYKSGSISHPFIKRKFSIAELKRISSFPKDFVLKGSYEKQAGRIGMSVCPLVMKAIAQTLVKEVLQKADN